MSDIPVEEAAEEVGGRIIINVSPTSINYDSGSMTMPEVVFWLEVIQQMITRKILGEGV